MKNALRNLIIEAREAETNALAWKAQSREIMKDARVLSRLIQKNDADFNYEAFKEEVIKGERVEIPVDENTAVSVG